ncbi:hypothetical protein DPX62_06030 [Salmonella enterica]|nr:hypothetical protein [Salmonella enterica]ECO0115434.1 hypothetical protein [Salmonella enterica subsp. enterica serovar Schwarzengrund]EDH8077436.1 hypothetical protein [Salmonella enterica subsp. enterica serovar Saintpaul]EBN3078282.1 hypothetical protein [Salmonella enterica]EDH9581521.1 hypothetical protein [Salmonella enterica subsp. enterica serovar Saintpaul]
MEKLNDLKNNNLPLNAQANKLWNKLHSKVGREKGYLTTTICEEWYTYSNFYHWYVENYVDGWDIDKDMKGTDHYSPDTCIFVPHHINLLFRGVISKVGRGVSRSNTGRFQAQAKWEDTPHKFGSYDTIEEATEAYEAGRKEYLYELSVRYSAYPELSTLLLKHSQ